MRISSRVSVQVLTQFIPDILRNEPEGPKDSEPRAVVEVVRLETRKKTAKS